MALVSSRVVPIVYGTEATPLKRPDQNRTHRWKVYVRSPTGESLETVFSSVTFKLHESFDQPQRGTRFYIWPAISKPPFELAESGWGEFVIQIRISFQLAGLRPMILSHQLRLHPLVEDSGRSFKPVISETYDEIVISRPGEAASDNPTYPPHRSTVFYLTAISVADCIAKENAGLDRVMASFTDFLGQHK